MAVASPFPLPADDQAFLERVARDGVVVETSGSTAKPKKVELSPAALIAAATATADAIGIGGWVLALPLTYIAGIMVGVRALVADQRIADIRAEPFKAKVFSEKVAQLPEGRWFTSLVPTQLARLVDAAESGTAARDALTRFDAILVGGQAIPTGLIERATALGARIVRTYGSAETAGGVVYDGKPIGDTQLRIDADGVLEIRTSSLTSGYVGDSELTAAAFRDGWYRTSDRAHFDDGRLVIDGRVDDVIISGGAKVSLSAIQKVIDEKGIPAVVTWVADEQWGQVPVVVSEHDVNLIEVREAVAGSLGKVARPARAFTVARIPLTPSGKVDRVALRRLVTGDEL